MYTNHPKFESPGNNDLLWRYFDLARYLDLLIREQLFFANIEDLEDPYEGLTMSRAAPAPDSSGLTVSSWHNSEDENYAMWKIYAPGSAGLAIQTTFDRLKTSFNKTDKPVWIGKISYYNQKHTTEDAANDDPFRSALQKRSIYAFEKEVRCCYQPRRSEVGEEENASGKFNGVYIPVDLDRLIDRVYVSPYAPAWFRDLVAGINEKFHLDKPIIHSDVLGPIQT